MKKKALISFAVTAKLISVFVFAYAKCWFSHDGALMHQKAAVGVANSEDPDQIEEQSDLGLH